MAIEKEVETIPKELEILDESVDVVKPQAMQEGGDVNVEMMEDGGAEVDFDPNAGGMEGGEQHEANLAEFMEEEDMSSLASDLQSSFDEMKSSRQEWEDGYTKGLDLLGFKYENRSEPFQGASGATPPSISRSCYPVSSFSLQRIITCRRSSAYTNIR